MSDPVCDRQVREAQQRLDELTHRVGRIAEQQPLVGETMCELATALQELRAAADELQRQNEELAEARELVEEERQRYQELFDDAPPSGSTAAEMINAVTGWVLTLDELMEVGRRRLNLFRVFNAREGINRNADKLPKKFFKQLAGTGPTAGFALTHEEIESALDTYYKLAGWTSQGVPTVETLKKHDVDWAAEYLPA